VAGATRDQEAEGPAGLNGDIHDGGDARCGDLAGAGAVAVAYLGRGVPMHAPCVARAQIERDGAAGSEDVATHPVADGAEIGRRAHEAAYVDVDGGAVNVSAFELGASFACFEQLGIRVRNARDRHRHEWDEARANGNSSQ
jgi:hypothetical protein